MFFQLFISTFSNKEIDIALILSPYYINLKYMRKFKLDQTLVPVAMLLLVVGMTSSETYMKFTLMGASILLNFTALLLNTHRVKNK